MMPAALAQRLRLQVQGTVQGLGFRPFIHRLATSLGLAGWVANAPEGVVIELEGESADLQRFLQRLGQEKPELAQIQRLELQWLELVGYGDFAIAASQTDGPPQTQVLPDIATCRACRQDVFNPLNRRYRYPFTNCTYCGPRFSIIKALPYDRPRTTMQGFPMCLDCRLEYANPSDRRFHAQPNACPACGPQLAFWDGAGRELAVRDAALLRAAQAILQGQIVAVKGLGGFMLLADARYPRAIDCLRWRKHRPHKPLALMVASLEQARQFCRVSEEEAALMLSFRAPIVLLQRLPGVLPLAPAIAPDTRDLGLMLPYTPLHHLLLAELGFPVVATSGNRASEPLCADEHQALERLSGIADCFLVHNRPIIQPIDDSVAQVVQGQPMVLRRARGYVPEAVALPGEQEPMLAFGPHLKNTLAIAFDHQAILSQHIGDMDTPAALEGNAQALRHFESLYSFHPQRLACDTHPDYQTTRLAEKASADQGLPLIRVQHHQAHILACLAEHGLEPPALGIAWDGTGYGSDGTIWGGEFFQVLPTSLKRIASLPTFPLPGGEQAVREPRRAALGLLFSYYGSEAFAMTDLPTLQAFSWQEKKVLRTLLEQKVNTPLTSSAGRLFDAIASLTGLCQIASFEGQAAMRLQQQIGDEAYLAYPFTLRDGCFDLSVLLEELLRDIRQPGLPRLAGRFHQTLVEMVLACALSQGLSQVILSGGCFQNRWLLEQCIRQLQAAGFTPWWPQRVPCNDGGIALGQLAAATRFSPREEPHVPGDSR